ncbi:MAG: hypothetical protein AAB432_01890 [Patescibacteria group bacterium]
MVRKFWLMLLALLGLIIILFSISLIASKKVLAPATENSEFQGPPVGSAPYVNGPSGPPPSSY